MLQRSQMLISVGNRIITKEIFNFYVSQVNFILRKYGIPKIIDKDESEKSKGGKGVKKSTKPSSKEKLAMGSTTSTKPAGSRERKPRPKDTAGTEKSARDAATSDPAAKLAKVGSAYIDYCGDPACHPKSRHPAARLAKVVSTYTFT